VDAFRRDLELMEVIAAAEDAVVNNARVDPCRQASIDATRCKLDFSHLAAWQTASLKGSIGTP
jgi:hypothetical protein